MRHVHPARPVSLLAALALLVALASSAGAHHGWSGYHNEMRELTGTARGFGSTYPHGMLHLEVGGTPWEIVLAPPSRLELRGLRADLIREGDTVTVQGFVHRERGTELRAERVRVNGQTFEMR
jgi:hypothetical protein